MFYELQDKESRDKYKEMLKIMGQLSKLFSENECPYLAYRSHENIFCKYFDAENLARFDCSADAKKGRIGIGLKTWMDNDDQKVAEFGKLKKSYENLSGMSLVRRIAEYRNERIRVTKKLHGIDNMYYHVVKRVPGAMQILECAFDPIDINNIKLDMKKGNENNTYFYDGKHQYHFSSSKNTLYMMFDSMDKLDEFSVEILDDPYSMLLFMFSINESKLIGSKEISFNISKKPKLCLPLYSVNKNGKFVAEKSGLNQWNASGRPRNADELYIPYNKKDRERFEDFFPPRDVSFILHLPNGAEISAKVCQEADKNNPRIGKAIMSNPNKVLGKWLLRDVFELPEKTIVTYEMLEKFGIDSVVFTKNSEGDYSVDFSEIGTYEEFYGGDE